MRRFVGRRPSLPLVVAFLALVVALSGSAAADPVVRAAQQLINGKDIRDRSITGKKVRLRTLQARHLSARAVRALRGRRGPTGPRGLEGPRGPEGPRGLEGPRGAEGPRGPEGADGSAVGYAQVGPSGEVVEGHARNITDANVTRPDQFPAGVYCFEDLPFVPRAIMVAPQGVGSLPDTQRIAYANIPPPNVGQAGCEIGVPNVVVVNPTDNERVDDAFWVWFED